MAGISELAGLSPPIFQRKKKATILGFILAATSYYLLLINGLSWIILDFCGIKCDSVTVEPTECGRVGRRTQETGGL